MIPRSSGGSYGSRLAPHPDPDDLARPRRSPGRSQADSSAVDDLSRSGDARDSQVPPSLVPPPLPDEVDFERLLADFTGDGIPLGLGGPTRARQSSEAYWWQPGSGGSILAVGSPRSGSTALLDLLLVGIAARMSANDLHVYAIEGLPHVDVRSKRSPTSGCGRTRRLTVDRIARRVDPWRTARADRTTVTTPIAPTSSS